jgi:serine O-acetyltransferase
MRGINYLASDYRRCRFHGLPSSPWLGILLAILANPGFRSVFIYRIQQSVQNLRLGYASRILAYLVSSLNHIITGAEFVPGCEFGVGLVIRHPTGIVVGEGVRVGPNCTLQHGVTFGLKNIVPLEVSEAQQYPRVEGNCTFGTHSVVIGAISIGSNVTVGANSTILRSVPNGQTVYGVHNTLIM